MPPPRPQAPPLPQPMLVQSAPGIARDGTRLSSRQYVDGRWVRFWNKLPRKMLGYREQRRDVFGIVRQFDVQSYDGFSYVHAGSQNNLQRYAIAINSGVPTTAVDRTPATGFVADPANNWQFQVMYDTVSNKNWLFAHATPSILDISRTVERPIFYGEVREDAALQPIADSDVSGGMLALWPFLVRFGNDGEVAWSPDGDPLAVTGGNAGTARPCGTKIVKGMPMRGVQGPAGLLWSLDALVRMQLGDGVANIFLFDTITTTSSLLSTNGIIEHEGIYYWATVSGFAMFNGVMRTMPNKTNVRWFLDNLNFAMRQKVFAVKMPQWNEIWWCFPFGNATECTHAVILDYENGIWYDTELPDGGRSAGVYEQIYHYPIMSSAQPQRGSDPPRWSTWQHEIGLDEVSGEVPIARAIPSFYETHEFNLVVPPQQGQVGVSKSQSYQILEPDMVQSGDLMFSMNTRANSRAKYRSTKPIIINQPNPEGEDNEDQTFKFKTTGRLTSFKFESNQAGGYYEEGATVVHVAPGDGRIED